MGFRLLLDGIFILSILVSSVTSDSTGSSSNDLIFSDAELPLTDGALAFNQADLPLDLASSPQDGLDPLSGDLDSSDLFANEDGDLGESFELADCSLSEPFPGKSRIRRRDESGVCAYPGITPPKSVAPPFDPASPLMSVLGFGILQYAQDADPVKQKKNVACGTLTKNMLPWGVCHMPDEWVGLTLTGVITIPPVLETFTLDHCVLSMFGPKACSG